MILIEKTQIMGLEPTIRGMRNPMNSWAKSDSMFAHLGDDEGYDLNGKIVPFTSVTQECGTDIGPNDLDLMLRLARAGSVDGKFRRMIAVYVDITAPLYWWKEFDTYKVGTVANSCSTMHKIHAKEFTLEDFSHEHLDTNRVLTCYAPGEYRFSSLDLLKLKIDALNYWREKYLIATKTEEYTGLPAKDIWWQMIQLLPSSYNQKRTVMLNYEVLSNIYQHRRNHKLDEWRELCKWIESLPYSEVITCNVTEVKKAELKTFVGNSDTTPVHGGAFDRPTKAEQEEIETLQAAINKLRAQKWSEEQIQMVLKAWGDVQKEIQEMRS